PSKAALRQALDVDAGGLSATKPGVANGVLCADPSPRTATGDCPCGADATSGGALEATVGWSTLPRASPQESTAQRAASSAIATSSTNLRTRRPDTAGQG